ncbi:MAG: ROK family protein, partial [Alphaproteobacteria bacterium]|nr:ROK family protein [Alphaproteobacteria bacterium]
LARALASIVNLVDPDVIVLGGGLSGISSLYDKVPPLMNNYTQVAAPATRLVQACHGPASGMRGAARIIPAGPEIA